jgi:toxin ParE1/3/4
MRLIWLDDAIGDLIAIRDYIAIESPASAAKIASQIQSRVMVLETHPHIGRAGRVAHTREFVFSGLPYIGVYRIDDERQTVEILYIIHTSKKYPPDE